MPLQIVDPGTPLTPEEVIELENNIGVKLPPDYVEFLLTYNGGKFAGQVEYPMIEPSSDAPGGFRYFYSVVRRPKWGLLLIEPPDLDVRDVFNIALDQAGSICLACSGDDYGKVYFVASDRGLNHWFCLVAKSFTEFLRSFRLRSDS